MKFENIENMQRAVGILEGASIRAEIASGGTSCHWCEDKVKADTVRQMRPAIIEEVISAVDKAFERQIYDSKWIDDKLEVVGFADIGYAIECWDEYIKPELIKKFEVENRLKECENGYAGTLFHDRCKLHDAEEKIKKLTEKNAKLYESCTIIVQKLHACKADTVRKMQERLTERLNRNSIFKGITMSAGETVYDVIDQIAKEMIGEGK